MVSCPPNGDQRLVRQDLEDWLSLLDRDRSCRKWYSAIGDHSIDFFVCRSEDRVAGKLLHTSIFQGDLIADSVKVGGE